MWWLSYPSLFLAQSRLALIICLLWSLPWSTRMFKSCSRWFRSIDLWVMSPTRFLCATEQMWGLCAGYLDVLKGNLLHQSTYNENQNCLDHKQNAGFKIVFFHGWLYSRNLHPGLRRDFICSTNQYMGRFIRTQRSRTIQKIIKSSRSNFLPLVRARTISYCNS